MLNYIIPQNTGGTSTGVPPTTQPTEANLWNNNGVPTWFDGTNNHSLLDFASTNPTSAFGTPLS